MRTNKQSTAVAQRAESHVPLEERVSYRCSLVAARITRFITPMLEERHGLTVVTWRVLAVIGRYGPLSGKEAAAHTSTDAFFVSRAIDQLVKLGYVSRTEDPRDRRRASLQLTRKGTAVHGEVEAVLNAVEGEILSHLDEFERQAFSGILLHLHEQCIALQDSGKTWRDYLP